MFSLQHWPWWTRLCQVFTTRIVRECTLAMSIPWCMVNKWTFRHYLLFPGTSRQSCELVATAVMKSQAKDLNLCDVPQSACLHEGWLPVDLGSLAKKCVGQMSSCHLPGVRSWKSKKPKRQSPEVSDPETTQYHPVPGTTRAF